MMGARARRRDRANRIINSTTGLIDYRPELATREPRALRAFILFIIMALVFVLGFASGTAYGAEQCIRSLEVRPTVMQRMTRGDIQTRVRIEPHADHRAYALSWTSDVGAEGRSVRELNSMPGELSPITQDPVPLRDMPGGHYFFTLAVYGAGGKLLERKTAEIHAPDDGGDR